METKFQPYVGPRPYERDDLALFLGRDYEADELLSLIISYRELLFYAQPGTGKTSLLNAKVIPFLEKEGFEILPLARVQGMISPDVRPDEIKNIYVFNTLMCWAKDEIPPRQLVQMSLRAYQEITVSNRGSPWQNRVVPLTVEVIPQNPESSHVFIGDFASQGIGVGVEK